MTPSPARGSLSLTPSFKRWRDFLTPPDDPALVAAGHKGELLVAKVRLWTALALLSVPGLSIALGPARRENISSLVAVTIMAVVAAGVLIAVRRRRLSASFPYFTSLLDVSVVSALHATYLMQGLPAVAVHSRTAFLAYFLAIGSACLRWDPRISLGAGLTAIAQYGLVLIAAYQMWPTAPANEVALFGQLMLGQQLGRIVMLGIFTFVCVIIVHQSLRLRISATHDALTRLMNRSYFEERIEDEWSRVVRHESPFCLALLDIDHFKRVNDEYGHDAGDAALRLVAQVLRRSLRRTDLVARWGGEEFAIAFPETRLAEAFGKLEQLRLDIASHVVVLSTGGEIRLTLSGGLAAARHDGRSLAELVAAADGRLLEAKREGRNRIKAAMPVDNPSGVWRAIVKVGTPPRQEEEAPPRPTR